MSLNISKSGTLSGNIIEPFISLADGSNWQLLLFHYVDGGNNLFTSSNAQDCTEWGLYSRLKWIDSFTYDSKYEFYIIQDDTVTGRWTQTNAPLTTTSVAGYTAVSGTPGGGICKCNGNTVLAATNTTSNWWRACGCWTAYQGGIPGFGSSVVCKKYLALYARIDKPKAFFENEKAQGVEFYEY